MKVTLMVVTSLDGKTTLGDKSGASPWSSPQDQAVFGAQIEAHDCVVMGSATYEAARHIIRPSASRPRTILTRAPQKFAAEVQPGIEFSSEDPVALIQRLESRGYSSLLLVGGAATNTRFLDRGLVDEVLVTVEPLLFGSGLPLAMPLRRTVGLELIAYRQLNSRGTLLVHYLVKKTKEELFTHEDSEV